MNLSPLPVQRFYSNIGLPLVGGKLFTYAAGTTTKIATYQNSSGTPNTNPVILNFRGEANVWLDASLTYKFVLAPANDTDPPANPIWTVDNISGSLTVLDVTQQFLGKILYPRTAAEIAAGVTPVNYFYPPGNVLRYGTNTTPGTTDMSTALQNAINANDEVFIPDGTYVINGVTYRSGISIIGENAATTILIATTVGTTVLSISGAHSNNRLANFTINGNSKATIGISDISPSQGSSSGLILDNVRVALCTDKAIYIKFMTYADLKDISANGNGTGTTYGLYLEGTFDSLVRGASLFYDCTAANIFLTAGCANVFFRGARAFKNSGFTVTRLVYIDSSYNCGFEQCTFETQGNAECTSEVELDKLGSNECIVFFRECYWLGTAATKTRCVKIGATAVCSLVRFDFCFFFKPTGNESVYAVNARQMLLFGSRDATSYQATTYVPASFRNDNGWGASQMNIPFSSPLEPWEMFKHAEGATETIEMMRLTAEYAPAGTVTGTTAGFGTGYTVRARTPTNTLSDLFELFGRTVAGVNGGELVVYTNAGSGLSERAHFPYNGGLVVGTAALATTATDGFLYIPSCAGAPTGVPTAKTGRVPMIYDTTNNKFYVYNGAWKGVVLA